MSKNHACCCTSHSHQHHTDHDHHHEQKPWLLYASLILFFSALSCQYLIQPKWFITSNVIPLVWYGLAYLLVGFSVWKQAFELVKRFDFFNEFSLMGNATLGAFIIGEYPEGVAVMLFYTIGELFQDAAVSKARRNVKALLDVRPNVAHVFRQHQLIDVEPETVEIGERIQVKVGEKIPLDGVLLSEKGSFNTSSLTGESKPKTYLRGETVLAGMINLENVIEVETSKKFNDTSISKILQLVEEASTRKAPTELFIRKFAKIYTPIVFFSALALVTIPYFTVENYRFEDWLYRGLVFLVISCPCALVISIPLGYFGGIGAASSNGILIKGSNFLDLIAKVDTVVMDKTGTVTEGIFEVQLVETFLDTHEFLEMVSALEKQSNHPIAKAVVAHHASSLDAENVEEISGKGLKGNFNTNEILVGNTRLLAQFGIEYPEKLNSIEESLVVAAKNQQYIGHIIVADRIKAEAKESIRDLKKLGVKKTVMLSGDRIGIVNEVANAVGIDHAKGELLPEDKVKEVEKLKAKGAETLAFVGDGINDAPVLALSDIGIAMGGLGSDAAIETADMVIQTDNLSKLNTSIKIGRATRAIVLQNIALALGIKIVVLLLGAEGVANMWEAVFADVGVALLAILNAVRIQKMKF